MPKTRTVYESGGSVVVSLPGSLRQEAGIQIGDTVVLDEQNGKITIAEAEISEAHRPGGGS